MRITRLGQGVDSTGRLHPDALERTLAVLRDYRALIDEHPVAGIRMAATSAVRDSANSDEFLSAATDVVGVAPEILTGFEEAELSFIGATAELDAQDGPFLVVDIGGGSTEFAVGAASMSGGLSVQMGCVRMTEKYIEHDPALPEELTNCLAEVRGLLDDVVREVPQASLASRLVGLAGTVSTTAAVELGLAEYDRSRIHHFTLTKEAVEDVFRTLATEDKESRLDNPGMEPGRVDVIVGGLCVLVGVMRYFEFDECTVSESDILDGLILSQLP
jgi:exopolyphosphatase/guanosine-5'-triphosphate,3'-diphosphate pyrophosphatase